MKGYFWANLNGTIINWEVVRFRLFRKMRPIDIIWELALETGAIDEIRLNVPYESAGTEEARVDVFRGDDRKFPEAFLTVADGRHLKGAKFRLAGMRFLHSRFSQEDVVGNKKVASSGLHEIWVGFDKVERTRVALPKK